MGLLRLSRTTGVSESHFCDMSCKVDFVFCTKGMLLNRDQSNIPNGLCRSDISLSNQKRSCRKEFQSNNAVTKFIKLEIAFCTENLLMNRAQISLPNGFYRSKYFIDARCQSNGST